MFTLFSSISSTSDVSDFAENILSRNEINFEMYACFFLAGMLGALANLLVRDNSLVLPRRITGRLVLGCLGPMFVGGFVGLIADGTFAVAALSGYVGSNVLDRFLPAISSQAVSPSCGVCDNKNNI